MVAKSYQELETIGEVFTSNGRKYINVKTKNGAVKTVRWYTEKEYAKMYPEAPAVNPSTDPFYKPQKEVLGFTNGYITIFKHNGMDEDNEWFRQSDARYARMWGWYFISTMELPKDLPEGVEPVQLPWELVGNPDGKLKSESEIRKGVDSLLYEKTNSQYIGEVGQRVELDVIVEKNISLNGNYGETHMHLLRSGEDLLIWTTMAKNWAVGSSHHIKGTVKKHQEYRGENQTVLTRCKEC